MKCRCDERAPGKEGRETGCRQPTQDRFAALPKEREAGAIQRHSGGKTQAQAVLSQSSFFSCSDSACISVWGAPLRRTSTCIGQVVCTKVLSRSLPIGSSPSRKEWVPYRTAGGPKRNQRFKESSTTARPEWGMPYALNSRSRCRRRKFSKVTP